MYTMNHRTRLGGKSPGLLCGRWAELQGARRFQRLWVEICRDAHLKSFKIKYDYDSMTPALLYHWKKIISCFLDGPGCCKISCVPGVDCQLCGGHWSPGSDCGEHLNFGLRRKRLGAACSRRGSGGECNIKMIGNMGGLKEAPLFAARTVSCLQTACSRSPAWIVWQRNLLEPGFSVVSRGSEWDKSL